MPMQSHGHGTQPLATGDSADDEERFRAGGDRSGERRVWRFVRPVLFADEETDEGAALRRNLVADRAAEHRIARFERGKNRRKSGRAIDFERDFAADLGEGTEVIGEDETDHFVTM